MNFWQLLMALFFTKKVVVEDLDHDSLQQFTPFMMNRYLSFYNKNMAVYTNDTLNKFTGLFDDKIEMLKLYKHLIPKMHYKKIDYIKKKAKPTKEEKEDISSKILMARNNMISRREVEMYIALQEQLTN